MTIRELIVELAARPNQQRPVRITDTETCGECPALDITAVIDHGDHVEITVEPTG